MVFLAGASLLIRLIQHNKGIQQPSESCHYVHCGRTVSMLVMVHFWLVQSWMASWKPNSACLLSTSSRQRWDSVFWMEPPWRGRERKNKRESEWKVLLAWVFFLTVVEWSTNLTQSLCSGVRPNKRITLIYGTRFPNCNIPTWWWPHHQPLLLLTGSIMHTSYHHIWGKVLW